MAYDYLSDLNGEQRRAVKHGAKDGSAIDAKPLLVIAGASTAIATRRTNSSPAICGS